MMGKDPLYKGDNLCFLCNSLTCTWVAECQSGGRYSFLWGGLSESWNTRVS